jgi:hypothetical protein
MDSNSNADKGRFFYLELTPHFTNFGFSNFRYLPHLLNLTYSPLVLYRRVAYIHSLFPLYYALDQN